LSSQISNGQIISYRYKRDNYPNMNYAEHSRIENIQEWDGDSTHI
jgi:hypothetical protein